MTSLQLKIKPSLSPVTITSILTRSHCNMAPSTTAATLSEEIDQLLEHYLELLDQYTTLRSQLSSLQSSVSFAQLATLTISPIDEKQVYQNISRANFSAERGIRYGPDFYDERMQASRVCRVSVPVPATDSNTTGARQEDNVVAGQSLDDVEQDTTDASTPRDAEGQKENQDTLGVSCKMGTAAVPLHTACFTISTAPNNGQPTENEHAAVDQKGEDAKPGVEKRDPIRMFGLLTPSALREAQAGSIKLVEEIVPRLVSLDAEMHEVEIRIRRARKWKARAEAKEGSRNEKCMDDVGQRVEVVV